MPAYKCLGSVDFLIWKQSSVKIRGHVGRDSKSRQLCSMDWLRWQTADSVFFRYSEGRKRWLKESKSKTKSLCWGEGKNVQMFIRQSQIKPDCSLLSSSLKTRSIHRDFWGKKLHWMKADVAQIHEAITSLRKTTCFGAQMDARYSSQGADVVSVFQIFPLDLFVCWNWREAFRVSSRLSQDKTKMQGERPGSESLFQSLKSNIY